LFAFAVQAEHGSESEITFGLRSGDSYTELGGFTQRCDFDEGLYFNPGPWRIPYHHRGLLDYCKRLGVTLEPFQQLNHNGYLHSVRGFNGRPQRIREIKTDFQGNIPELLAKVIQQGKLAGAVSREDQEVLLEALKSWVALDKDYAYKAGPSSAQLRGYQKDPGGGVGAAPIPGQPISLSDILTSNLWRGLLPFAVYDYQTTMFQPVGGMDMIAKASLARLTISSNITSELPALDKTTKASRLSMKMPTIQAS
jgi:monoamine oxidase